jgi:hypothetical protein
METKTITFADVAGYVYGQATPEELRQLNGLVVDKIRNDRKLVQATIMTQVKVGDRVRLTGLSPKYMNGLEVEVVGKAVSKLNVRFVDVLAVPTRARDRFGTRPFKVPANCVE